MPTDTPTTTESQAARLEHVYAQLAALWHQPEVAARLRNGGENEWSALEIVGHMIEMIPHWLADCECVIASDAPITFGRTHDAPERLEGVARAAAADPTELLRQLQIEIEKAATAIRAMTVQDLAKTANNVRRGEMSVQDIIESMIVGHAEEHLAQVREALAK